MKVVFYAKEFSLPGWADEGRLNGSGSFTAYFGGQTIVLLRPKIKEVVPPECIEKMVKSWFGEEYPVQISHCLTYTELLLPSEGIPNIGVQHPSKAEGLVGRIMQQYDRKAGQKHL